MWFWQYKFSYSSFFLFFFLFLTYHQGLPCHMTATTHEQQKISPATRYLPLIQLISVLPYIMPWCYPHLQYLWAHRDRWLARVPVIDRVDKVCHLCPPPKIIAIFSLLDSWPWMTKCIIKLAISRRKGNHFTIVPCIFKFYKLWGV